MSKKIFNPDIIPVHPQSTDSPDFNDDSIMNPGNPYIMRGKMKTGTGNAGEWSVVNLVDYQSDPTNDSDPDAPYKKSDWTSSKLYNQLSSLNISKWSTKYYDDDVNAFIEYVDTVNILLNNDDITNSPITGVDIWFRWMPSTAFNGYITNSSNKKVTGVEIDEWDCVRETPCSSWQTETWVPTDWEYIGTRTSTSFTITIPVPKEYKEWEDAYALDNSLIPDDWFSTKIPENNNTIKDIWFQILVTNHTTWTPNKYNYRWIGNSDYYDSSDFTPPPDYKRTWTPGVSSIGLYKVGDSFVSHDDHGNVLQYNARGYLPWNPYYGVANGNQWDTYQRQRTTFSDIAIFAPKKWRKTYP